MATEAQAVVRLLADTTDALSKFNVFGTTVTKIFSGITGALGGIQSGLALIGQGLDMAKFSGQMKQLETVTNLSSEAMNRLKDAVDGSLTKMQIMQLAARGMNSDLNLSTDEMEQLFKAADNLADKGIGETTSNVEALMTALKGNTRHLRELGIVIDETTLKSKGMAAIWDRIFGIAGEELSESSVAKEADRMAANLQDAIDRLKVTLGDLVVKLEPFINLLAQTIGAFADFLAHPAASRTREEVESRLSEKSDGELLAMGTEAARAEFARRRRRASGIFTELEEQDIFEEGAISMAPKETPLLISKEQRQKMEEERKKDLAAAKQAAAEAHREEIRRFEEIIKTNAKYFADIEEQEKEHLERQLQIKEAVEEEIRRGDAEQARRDIERKKSEIEREIEIEQKTEDARRRAKEISDSFVVSAEREVFMDTWNSMSEASLAALDAALTSGDGIAKAWKMAAAGALKAMAVESAVRALYETGLGVASLAFGPIGGVSAGAHFKAAAIFAGAAVAAGAGAAALGASLGGFSGSSTGGAGAGAGSVPSGFTGSSGGRMTEAAPPIIINVGAGFVGQPKDLAESINRAMREGDRSGRTRPIGENRVVVFQ